MIYDFYDRLTGSATSSFSNFRVTYCMSLLQLFPSNIPDVSSQSPLIMSGRYDGNFPDVVKLSGTLSDMSNFTIDLKVQKAKDLPLNRVTFINFGAKFYKISLNLVGCFFFFYLIFQLTPKLCMSSLSVSMMSRCLQGDKLIC